MIPVGAIKTAGHVALYMFKFGMFVKHETNGLDKLKKE